MSKYINHPLGKKYSKSKKDSLPKAENIAEAMMSKNNKFLEKSTSHDTRTENMALAHSSTGDPMVDDFAKSGSWRGRDIEDIFVSASVLWTISPVLMFKLTLYLRMITRRVKGFVTTEKVQKGQGNRDESLGRLLWIAYNHPKVFYKNLWLVPLAGSFKDLWTLMAMDFRNELDRSYFYDLFNRALKEDSLADLVIKYLPQIRANSKIKTQRAAILNFLAKEFCKYSKEDYRTYRLLKSSGKAHKWQQQIAKGYYDEIDFNHIPGKALLNMVNSKFLKNHNLVEKYEKWIMEQPIAKFTGYVYELYIKGIRAKKGYQIQTVNKQFDGLIELAKKDEGGLKGNVWCCVDTSPSMYWKEARVVKSKNPANDIYAGHVGVSLAIYFSNLNEGAFKDHIIMFSTDSTKLQLYGTFIDKANQIKKAKIAYGSTNWQSVIDEIVRIRRQNPGIPVEQYPTTLLVVSDMQFNPSGKYGEGWSTDVELEKTNYEEAKRKLKTVNLPMPNIIWWDCVGRRKDNMPSRVEDNGTACMSGFDGSVITKILGGDHKPNEPLDMKEVMMQSLDQELLSFVKVFR